jgi:hypothetical protein
MSDGTYKLQLWATDEEGNPEELHDEVDVLEEEFEYALDDNEAANVLLGSLKIGRLA